jgi:hypothetical protein
MNATKFIHKLFDQAGKKTFIFRLEKKNGRKYNKQFDHFKNREQILTFVQFINAKITC